MTGREIIEALKCSRQSCVCAKGKLVHCPAHQDANPSLSITEKDGKALLHCHTGCSQAEVIGALREKGLWGEAQQRGLHQPIPIRSGGRGSLVKTYQFVNTAGEIVAEHGRFEGANGKSFAWRIPGSDWREGLGTVAIHDLPLYGLQDVLQRPFEPVWVVEGEKAADACREAGLVAVCLGGGASQQTFGNALDPLKDREVVLWPDNDEPGGALMARIAGVLPNARYCRPVVPPKGDAHDYFTGGGTVEALDALLATAEPHVEIISDNTLTVTMPVPAGRIIFTFSDIVAGARAIDCDMRMSVEIPGKRRTPFSRRLNLSSSSGIEGLRREIQAIYPGKDLEWPALISEATDIAKETWRGIDRSVDLANVPLPEIRQWAIERFAPKGLSTIVFGMGGGGKSFLCADIALHCLYGMPWKGRAVDHVYGVMIIDYEDAEDEWRLRVQQLCDGYGWPFPERGYRYYPGRAIPVADQIAQIREVVEHERIGLVVIDSAISAVGGDVIDMQSPARLVNALQSIGVSAIIIAHNTKAEDARYPLGSIAWHNLVRATHYLESTQTEGSVILDAALHNKKGNRGLQKPLPLRFVFSETDTGPVTIDLTASIPESLRTEEQNDRWAVMQALVSAERPMTARELASELDIPEASVRAHLSKGRGKWATIVSRGMWAALTDREDAV